MSTETLCCHGRPIACDECAVEYREELAAADKRIESRQSASSPDLSRVRGLIEALSDLRQNANRLCDRCLGGTYEDDCRRSIANADKVLAAALGELKET